MHCTYEFNTPGVIHEKVILCSGTGILFSTIPKFPLSKKEDLTRTWKTGIMRTFIHFYSSAFNCYYIDRTEKDEMEGTCRVYGKYGE